MKLNKGLATRKISFKSYRNVDQLVGQPQEHLNKAMIGRFSALFSPPNKTLRQRVNFAEKALVSLGMH